MESIAHRLKRLRKKKEYSAKQVAKLAGVPVTTYREWEYGRTIKGEPYLRLATALGVSLSELITGNCPSAAKALEKVASIRVQLDDLEKDLQSLF